MRSQIEAFNGIHEATGMRMVSLVDAPDTEEDLRASLGHWDLVLENWASDDLKNVLAECEIWDALREEALTTEDVERCEAIGGAWDESNKYGAWDGDVTDFLTGMQCARESL